MKNERNFVLYKHFLSPVVLPKLLMCLRSQKQGEVQDEDEDEDDKEEEDEVSSSECRFGV